MWKLPDLTMGAATASILSEVYLQYIEHREIYNILQHNIVGYFKYVDDIVIVYNHKNRNIQNVLQQCNFTIEQEVHHSTIKS